MPLHQSLPAATAAGQPCSSAADTELLRQACTSGLAGGKFGVFMRKPGKALHQQDTQSGPSAVLPSEHSQ